jgi:hypothetical protein
MKIADHVRRRSGCLLISVLLSFPARALADGGSLRLSEERGNYQIAIFTSPTPLRAGPVDISVLVQDAVTHEPVSDVQILVKAARRDRRGAAIRQPATFEAATNKLFQAAAFNLNEPGWWQVEIDLDGPVGKVQVALDLEASKPLPRYLAMWPWLTWPALPILLFGAHQYLVNRPGEKFENAVQPRRLTM